MGRMADARKPFRWKWVALIGGVALICVLVYSTIEANQRRYEVCVDFHGRSHCATASGATERDAVRSAQEIDCSQIANGRDENMVCLDTAPSSTRALDGGSSSGK
jgi:hypothetical protein